MTLRDIVAKLQQAGYKITYRNRTDGSIIVTSINGKKFKGVEGNKVVRFMAGETLSTRRAKQLTKITKTRVRKKPKTPTPATLEKQRLRVTRKWRKRGLEGSIAKSNLEAMIKDRGLEGAKTYLDRMEKRAEDITPIELVDGAIQRLTEDIDSPSSTDEEKVMLQDMKSYLENNKDNIPFKNFFRWLDLLYDWEKERLPLQTSYIFFFSNLGK